MARAIDPVGRHLPLKLGKKPARPGAVKFKLANVSRKAEVADAAESIRPRRLSWAATGRCWATIITEIVCGPALRTRPCCGTRKRPGRSRSTTGVCSKTIQR